MEPITKLWDKPPKIDDSLPFNPFGWPEIFTFKFIYGFSVLFYRSGNGYRMRICIDDFEPIDFKPFQLKDIANVTKCFLLSGPTPMNYTLSVSRPGALPEQIKLTVATPGDVETSSPSAKPKKNNPRNHKKGSTSGGHQRRPNKGQSTPTTN